LGSHCSTQFLTMTERHEAIHSSPFTVVAAKVSQQTNDFVIHSGEVSKDLSAFKKDEGTSVVAVVPNKQKLVSAIQQSRAATLALAKNTQDKTVTIIKNPHFQVVTVTTASGTVSLAAVGGAFGCMGGMVVGAMVGTVPALLTFGTSIPVGAVVGGALGAPAGACMAGIAGGVAGGAIGHGGYVWRAEIRDGVIRFKVAATDKKTQLKLALTAAKDSTVDRASKACAFASERREKARAFTTHKSQQVGALAVSTKTRSYAVVTDKRVQVTAASAAGGAVVVGTAGGAVGTVAGAGTGALVGLPAAIFTFGLSIPICATIGGGMGCVAGATSAGAVGGVAGGAAGYNAHKYQHEIAGGAQSAWSKVRNGTNLLKVKAADSVAQVRTMCGTGGTGGAGTE